MADMNRSHGLLFGAVLRVQKREFSADNSHFNARDRDCALLRRVHDRGRANGHVLSGDPDEACSQQLVLVMRQPYAGGRG